MADYREIEKKAAAERQALAASLDELSGVMSAENLQTHAGQLVESYGGDIGRQAWGAAKQNPAAFALVGVGISLMLTGTGTRAETRASQSTRVPSKDAYAGFDERVAAAETEMKQEVAGMSEQDATPRAAWLRAKLNDGLDALPTAARERVLSSREAVLDAQEKIEARARATAAKSQTFLHEQPLAVGAIALGMGALIGALLPSTRREDDLLGEHRDAAMAKANETLREEMEKLHSSAKSRLESAAG
jgi:ElaB/YqjD/DUF883 family membrane-anchored ribosome-binding protein